MKENLILKPHDDYRPISQIITNERWRPLLLFSVIFVSYLLSMPKTVMLEDDGLFIMSSYFLGIAHPPGYPIHTLVGYLFTHIPIGSVASRAHAMSGFFGALGCLLIALIVLQILRSRIAAYTGALILAWSPVYWSQAIIAEVYTLNAFFFLLIILLLLDAVHYHATNTHSAEFKKRLSIKISVIAFCFGLSLTNHWPLMILSSSCYLIIAWPLLKEIAIRPGYIITSLALGLTPYLWMYLYTPPPPGYSVMGPINNLDDLWFYISRKGYSSVDNSISAGLTDKLAFSGFFSKEALMQFFPLGTVFAVIGLITQWKSIGKYLSLALVIGFLSSSYLLIWLLNFDFTEIKKDVIKVYFIPSYCIMAIWLATGIFSLEKFWGETSKKTLKLLASIFAVSLVIILNAKYNYRHYDDWTKQYADTLFAAIDKNSVVFTDGDTTAGPLAYFHMIENMRPDTELRNVNGFIYSNRLFKPNELNKEAEIRVTQEYLRTEQRSVIFTTKPTINYGSRFNGLYYIALPNTPSDSTTYAIDNTIIINYLLDLASNPQPIDKWTRHRNKELISRAVPIFVAMYLGKPALQETALYFIKQSSRLIHGKIILVDTLLGLNGNFPRELGDIESLLKEIKTQLEKHPDKTSMSNYYLLSAINKKNNNDINSAIQLLKQSLNEWPHPDNRAQTLLNEIYQQLETTDQYEHDLMPVN